MELTSVGLSVVQQQPLEVLYKGVIVGEFFADILVEGGLILEIKALSGLVDAHKVQLMNYLTGTGMELGLLINFGRPKVEIKRVIRSR